MRVRNILVIAALLAPALCLHITPAAAQQETQVSDFALSAAIDPQHAAVTEKGYFIYEMAPGSANAGTLLVRNKSNKPLDVQLAVVPAFTAQNGGSAFGTAGEANTGPATWVKLDQTGVTLQPGASGSVPFHVQVPAGVQPGQYLAGVAAYKPKTEVARQVANGQNQAAALLDVQMRYVVAVQVNVPGAWNADMSIPEVGLVEQPSGTFLGVHLKNSGDVLLRPNGTVKVRDDAGNTVVERAISMGTFVTGTEVRYSVPWPSIPKPGSYNVRVELSYGDGKTTTYDRAMVVAAPQEAQPAQASTGQQRTQAGPAESSGNTNETAGTQGTQAAPEPGVATRAPWADYALGFLMVMIVALLSLNLLRGRGYTKAS